jgi:hypothetical protein
MSLLRILIGCLSRSIRITVQIDLEVHPELLLFFLQCRDISKVTDVVETETGGEHVETEPGLKRFGVLG